MLEGEEASISILLLKVLPRGSGVSISNAGFICNHEERAYSARASL